MPSVSKPKQKRMWTDRDAKDFHHAVKYQHERRIAELAPVAAGSYFKVRKRSSGWSSSVYTQVFSGMEEAINKGDIDTLKLLLPYVEIFSVPRAYDETWFDLAWGKKKLSVVRFFIDSTEHFRDDGKWLRSVSTSAELRPFFQMILPYSDPKATDEEGRNALMIAARFMNTEALDVLLPLSDPQAIDIKGRDALMHALEGLAGKPGISESGLRWLAELIRVCGVDRKDIEGCAAADRIAIKKEESRGAVESKSIPAEAAKLLIEAGAKPGSRQADATHQLFEAVRSGNLELALQLAPLSDMESVDGEGNTPLLLAARMSLWRIVLALAPMSNINRQDGEGFNALMRAVVDGELEHVRMLTKVTDLDLRDEKGRTAAMIAAEMLSHSKATLKSCQIFLRVFDPGRSKGQAVLHHLVGLTELLEAALPYCDPDERDAEGATALHRAIKARDQAAFDLLFPVTNVNLRDKQGQTPFMFAMRFAKSELVNALLPLSNHCDPDLNGDTPLMFATRREDLDTARALLPGSDAKAANAIGETALILAAGRREPELVAMLVDISNPNARRDDGRNALMLALDSYGSRVGLREVVDMLAPVTDLSAVDKAGKSVFDRASSRDFKEYDWLLPSLRACREAAEMRDLIPKASTQSHRRIPPTDELPKKSRRGL